MMRIRTLALCISLAIVMTGTIGGICHAQDLTPVIQPPANIVLTNDSEYEQPDNYRFRLRYAFEKNEELIELISMSENERASKYGEAYRLCEAQIQIDWSLNSQSDWKYNASWDRMEGQSGGSIWEYYKTDVQLNNKKGDSRNILFMYYEEAPEWYEKPWGMSHWFEGMTYTKVNNYNYTVHYLDLEQHTIYTRSRFIVKMYSHEGDAKYIMSDWSNIVGIGKGIEAVVVKEPEEEIIYDAYGPLETQLAWNTVSDWAKASLESANEERIIPERFTAVDMSAPLTRAEFAAVAVKLYENMNNVVTVSMRETPFEDTSDPEVSKAKKLGIVNGISDREFAPECHISREEATTIVYRVIQAGDEENQAGERIDSFADDHEISVWAHEAVYAMAGRGFMMGREENRFCPSMTMTREESIILSYRVSQSKRI